MRTLKSAALAALLAGAVPLAAFAHAMMTASVPKDGATVPAGLAEIELDFSKPVRLTVVGVVRTGDETAVGLAGALPGTYAKSAVVKVEPLAAGSYKVSWTAVAADGHVMSGAFAFAVSGADPPSGQ